MNLGEIVGDALRYPFSDWKKILIFGIIIVFSGTLLNIGTSLGIRNFAILGLLFIIGIIIGFLVQGYQLRIIQSSLAGMDELPKFNNWKEMFINGIKVFITFIVYMIPAILIIAYGALSFGPDLIGLILNPSSNPSAADLNTLLNTLAIFSVASLYILIVYPLFAMALANMASNDSKLGAAFRIGEIFSKIGSIGWLNLIIWYIITGIILIILILAGTSITNPISKLTLPIVGPVLLSLIVMPYAYMYFYRSIALIYKSE